MDKKKSFLFLERKHQKRSKDQGDTSQVSFSDRGLVYAQKTES